MKIMYSVGKNDHDVFMTILKYFNQHKSEDKVSFIDQFRDVYYMMKPNQKIKLQERGIEGSYKYVEDI